MRVGWVFGWGAWWCGVGGVAGARHLTTGRVDGARDGAVVRARARLHGGARGSAYRSQAGVWGRESAIVRAARRVERSGLGGGGRVDGRCGWGHWVRASAAPNPLDALASPTDCVLAPIFRPAARMPTACVSFAGAGAVRRWCVVVCGAWRGSVWCCVPVA